MWTAQILRNFLYGAIIYATVLERLDLVPACLSIYEQVKD